MNSSVMLECFGVRVAVRIAAAKTGLRPGVNSAVRERTLFVHSRELVV